MKGLKSNESKRRLPAFLHPSGLMLCCTQIIGTPFFSPPPPKTPYFLPTPLRHRNPCRPNYYYHPHSCLSPCHPSGFYLQSFSLPQPAYCPTNVPRYSRPSGTNNIPSSSICCRRNNWCSKPHHPHYRYHHPRGYTDKYNIPSTTSPYQLFPTVLELAWTS